MSQIIVLKTNDLNDARLERAVMGRKRFLRVVHKGVPYQDSIEHKIFLLKKELGVSNRPVEHQVRLFGEWKKVSVEKYLECEKAGFAVRIVQHSLGVGCAYSVTHNAYLLKFSWRCRQNLGTMLNDGSHCPSVICFYPRVFESKEEALASMEAQLNKTFHNVLIPRPKYFNAFNFEIRCDHTEGRGQVIEIEVCTACPE